MFLVDTDTCSAYLKGDQKVFARFGQYGGRIHISAISLAELHVWARRPTPTAARIQGIRDFLLRVNVLPVDSAVAVRFGEVRAGQFAVGQFTPEMDLLIASTALAHGLTLVTHNTADPSSSAVGTGPAKLGASSNCGLSRPRANANSLDDDLDSASQND